MVPVGVPEERASSGVRSPFDELAELLVPRGALLPLPSDSWPAVGYEFSPGDVLADQWKVEEALGEGASAEVYAVQSVTSEQQAAAKVLRRQLMQRSEQVAQFRQEAQLLAELRGASTVRLLQSGELQDGRPYLVLERLTGQSLHMLLRERKAASSGPCFSPHELAGFCHDVLGILAELHEQGWVHRDVKPRNLQCLDGTEPRLRVQLIDFGIAERMGEGDNEGRAVMGSPNYVAPEVARGERTVPATDLYSLGITLVELIAGEPPWSGRSAYDLLYCHMNPELPVPLPAAVRMHPMGEVIARAVAKRHEERFDSALAMLAAVEEAMRTPQGGHGPVTQAETSEQVGHDAEVPAVVQQALPPRIAPPLLFDVSPAASPTVSAEPSARSQSSLVGRLVMLLVVVGMLLGLMFLSGLL